MVTRVPLQRRGQPDSTVVGLIGATLHCGKRVIRAPYDMEQPGGSTSLQALTEMELYAEEVVPSLE